MKLDYLFLIFLVVSLIFCLFTGKSDKENFADITTGELDAIKNLASLATDLTISGKLINPGGLDVKGELTVEGNLNVKGSVNFLPEGAIIAWTGSVLPKGWALCDGANGTPDLRGRFIVGSGQGNQLTNRNINDKGNFETRTIKADDFVSLPSSIQTLTHETMPTFWSLAYIMKLSNNTTVATPAAPGTVRVVEIKKIARYIVIRRNDGKAEIINLAGIKVEGPNGTDITPSYQPTTIQSYQGILSDIYGENYNNQFLVDASKNKIQLSGWLKASSTSSLGNNALGSTPPLIQSLASNLLDGINNTWVATDANANAKITIDLSSANEIKKIIVTNRQDGFKERIVGCVIELLDADYQVIDSKPFSTLQDDYTFTY